MPSLLPEVLEDDTAIAGRVLGEDGEPIGGVSITVEARRLFDPEAGASAALATLSDVAGFYAFRYLEPGLYWLQADPTFDYEGTHTMVRTGVHSADLVLKPKDRERWVQGMVTGRGGQALEGVRVIQNDRPAQETLTNAQGGYSLPLALSPRQGSAGLRFQLEGYRELLTVVLDTEWNGQDWVQVDVELEPLESLVTVGGTVTSTTGEPIAGERVGLVSGESARASYAPTDDRGQFKLRDVPSGGDYAVTVRPQGPYQDFARRGLRVTENGLDDLRIALQPLEQGSISGMIIDAEGKPIPGFNLTVRSSSAAHHTRPITADAQGRFFVDDVPAGNLVFQSRGYPSLTVLGVRLDAGMEQEVELVLDWGTHQVTGQIVDAQGIPVSAGQIWLSMDHRANGIHSRSTRMTTADASGFFTFTGIGPGLHQVRVDAPGFETATQQHLVAAPVERIRVILD
jgi:hypothetical protein